MRAVILSDIHLGPGGAFTLFRERDALVELLGWVRDGEPTELILAGDVFDFLQCEDYQGFDIAKAAPRFAEIAANSDGRAVLNALAAVQADPRHRLVVMAGNHDPELVLPSVRAALSAALGGAPVWADDAPLRARSGTEPPIWGRALPLGTGAAWVVHGDRWDTHNFIDREEVALAAVAGASVRLPVGSHLVFEVLSQLTSSHPWIHELKPELPAVFLLLLYLDPRRTMRFLKEHTDLTQELMLGAARSWARQGPLFAPEVRPDPSPDDLARWIGAQVGRELDAPQAVAGLEAWLRYGHAEGALASHEGPRRALLRAWLRLIRWRDRFGDVDGPDRIPEDAARFLPSEVRLLVAGHTHGRRAFAHGQVRYLNTGTWLPVARLPDGDLTGWIDRLEAGQGWEAASPRTFAVVEPDGGAALMTWSDAHRAEEVARA